MVVACRNCPLRKLPLFKEFTADELGFMERFKRGELRLEAGTQILTEGTSSTQLFTVLEGQGLRYKSLPEGTRQVTNFIFPGDFLGLQAGTMGVMNHSVESTTRMRLCVFDRQELTTVFREYPERAFDLTWLAAIEEHFLGEALATVGQRAAIERIAWAFVEVHRRAAALGLITRNGIPFPYRQQDLADSLGLSLVHTNKTLARLRERQIAGWSDGRLVIHKLDSLAEIAGQELGPAAERPLM